MLTYECISTENTCSFMYYFHLIMERDPAVEETAQFLETVVLMIPSYIEQVRYLWRICIPKLN